MEVLRWYVITIGFIIACVLILFGGDAQAEDWRGPAEAGLFCFRNMAECQPAVPAEAPESQRALIEAINAKVNSEVKWTSDMDHYGRRDFWALVTDGRGDCEDIALTKVHELRQAGIPAGALSIAEVEFWDQTYHVVALVNIAGAIYALDYIEGHEIEHPEDARYWVIGRRSFADPQIWIKEK